MTQNSQYRLAAELVEKIHAVLGRYEGYRTLHADGRLYRGTFRATPGAAHYSRAIHLSGQEVPVTVRYSKGGGDPFAHFNATVGMATRFYLPDGRITHLVMLSQKLFIARSIDQFIALVEAAAPLKPGGPPNLDGLKAILPQHPNAAAVFQMRAESPAPVSFAHTAFHSVHAFRLLNAADQETPARFHWIPVAGEQGQPPANLADKPVDILFEELTGRLAKESVAFDLQIELAEPGDPLDDATALWPEERRRVTIGRLTLMAPTDEAEIGDPMMNHDPSQLVDGIEPTDDPILQIRRGVYEASAALRSGGWRRSSSLPVSDTPAPTSEV
ncbi:MULTISPECIES: catalase [unclassified Novosphingobium]|uniref:catalase n=1 Tax=unclassified Novosphingobium TaxID=2644732 RepID=UPI00146E7025|nr:MULTISPECIES: catalase [unclassified Novosphingobium]NMN07355.1 catalase [Novosphingobium sp. SG919]NMN89664.1 catalase [Novosphingobium sp. SG916]